MAASGPAFSEEGRRGCVIGLCVNAVKDISRAGGSGGIGGWGGGGVRRNASLHHLNHIHQTAEAGSGESRNGNRRSLGRLIYKCAELQSKYNRSRGRPPPVLKQAQSATWGGDVNIDSYLFG